MGKIICTVYQLSLVGCIYIATVPHQQSTLSVKVWINWLIQPDGPYGQMSHRIIISNEFIIESPVGDYSFMFIIYSRYKLWVKIIWRLTHHTTTFKKCISPQESWWRLLVLCISIILIHWRATRKTKPNTAISNTLQNTLVIQLRFNLKCIQMQERNAILPLHFFH